MDNKGAECSEPLPRYEPLYLATQHYAQHTALRLGETALTYCQLYYLVSNVVKQLSNQQVLPGQHLMAVGHNSLELLVLQLACLRMGVLFCPVSPRFSVQELDALADKLQCQWVWQREQQGHIGHAISITLPVALERLPSQVPEPVAPCDYNAGCNVILTSGTSGLPKAVVYSLANHYYSALGAEALIPLAPGDCWLLSLPLYHIGGAAIVMRCLLAGAAIYLPQREEPLEQVLCARPISHLSLVATQLWRLLHQSSLTVTPLSSLKVCLLGGGPVSAALLKQAQQRQLPCWLSYGLSEMSSQVATVPANPDAPTYCGKPLLGRQLALKRGEICVKGEVLALGYFDKGLQPLPLDNEGWYHSGDLGALKPDGIWVQGRKSNLFISGGENIYPEEIEAKLLKIDGVAMAIVVPVDDPEYGQRPVALIKWHAAARTADELVAELEQQMARFKIPTRFLSWPEEHWQQQLKPNREQIKSLVRQLLGNRASA